jgi:UrcA family protein
MRKFMTSLTTVATLTLAAVPALGLVQAAHAAEPTARIVVGDLNLRDPAQAAQFNHRVDVQGEALCRQVAGRYGQSRLVQADCLTQVRLQVLRQLSSTQRQALRHASVGAPMQVAVR